MIILDEFEFGGVLEILNLNKTSGLGYTGQQTTMWQESKYHHF